MTATLDPIDLAKYAAARRAVDFVEDGMRLGLGTGSTAAWMVRCLGARIRSEGLRVTGVPTSTRTAELARACGVTVVSLDESPRLDLTLDGADEFDAGFALIKGGGGALLHEKIVAAASARMIVIADRAKAVTTLGAFPLPVEVIAFGWRASRAMLETCLSGMDVDACDIVLRQSGNAPYRTDEGNLILDLHLRRIGDPAGLARALNAIPGVVEHGLFLDLCDAVVIGDADGAVELRDAASGTVTQERIDIAGADAMFGAAAD